jgi:tRNA A-37 threonylcarbamoyl transferase component Bud32
LIENWNENIQINLKGFSGSKIQVIRSGQKTFVRKTAKDRSHNNRMQKEIEKMRRLSEISECSNDFKIPNIQSVRENDDGLMVYELDFIPGESLDHCLYKLNSEKIKFFAKKIGKIIETISEKSSTSETNQHDFILQKFNELISELNKKKDYTNLVTELFNEYKEKIKNLKIDKISPHNKPTFCHGDLSLDNIIITRQNQMYLIDPLHNDFENFMWDYAKVFQSSMTHWNLIKYNNFQISSTKKKVQIKPNEHITMFHQHFLENLSMDNSPELIIYLAATLSRVAKYAKSDKQLAALLILINELLTNYSNGKCELNGTLNSLRW